MGLFCSRRSKDKEIISKESLNAVLEVIEFLKVNVHGEWIFGHGGDPDVQRRILSSLIRGDRDRLRNNWADFSIESAAALQLFLTNLREPLIPSRVQQLVLAENTGVPEKTVALDALGLLQQELPRRHLTLVMALLDLLHTVTCRVSSELNASPLSDVLLPAFFDVHDLMHCSYNQKRQVQSTYHELILAGPCLGGQQCFWPLLRSQSELV